MSLAMETMPDIWGDGTFVTSGGEVLAALAQWAVRQSPYLVPENLAEALAEFDKSLRGILALGLEGAEAYFTTTCENLRKQVFAAIEECPLIVAWNQTKVGDHQVVSCSRYDRPAPDHDFIDLHALARNVAHSITLSNKYEQAHENS